ncbi:hypothetical protein [Phyllobacterium myrsinacearum]|uniref:Uncharacterized protein n=1 Tax=Phyllobacterium myrsinacearum TaxID=28101 RepID=A0A839EKI7_9HYPH|nr:hypothetical protein [Phyllobacterium myrsinacearum]MBA8876997.1 hypothetical protein [Phyllobacterium myrsinacearum]
MAKGQQRSNREVRKPKKDKVEVKAAVPFASSIGKQTEVIGKGKPKT